MGQVIQLAQYQRAKKKHKQSEPAEPDEIVIRLQPSGGYTATLTGSYDHHIVLAIEHLADLIGRLSQSIFE